MDTLKETFADLVTSTLAKMVGAAVLLGSVPAYFLSLATAQVSN